MIPSILESEGSSKEYRKNWARLIQKIYEVDPLTCPKCSGAMKVISVIEDKEVIKKILKHLGLWERKAKPPLKTVLPEKTFACLCVARRQECSIDYSSSQIHPDSEKWLYLDPEYTETFPS